MTSLLRAVGLRKRFGGFVALKDVSLDVAQGERIGILGPNGSGKSTLVNCITGLLRVDTGEVFFDHMDLTSKPAHLRARAGIARTFQLPKPFHSMSVIGNVQIPLDYASTTDSGASGIGRAESLLHLVGMLHLANQSTSALTQIELRKLELAKAIAAQPKLLFADEALAGLSTSEVDEILDLLLRLNAQGMTIIMIEHIMRAVTRFSQRVVVLVAGSKIADGPPDEVLRNPEVERAYLGD